MSKFAKVIPVVQVGGKYYSRRYGPGQAQRAAEAFACCMAGSMPKHREWRNYDATHRVAFRRVLPVMERILGESKNKTNPRFRYD